MKITVVKIENAYESMTGLFPLGAQDSDIVKQCRDEEIVEIVKARNPKFHRKAFALFKLVLDNQDIYDNMDDLLVEIKLKCGHYQEHLTTKGKIIYIPKSIAFENMDELEFQEFFNKAINVILRDFCQGMDRNILEDIVGF